MSAAVRCSVQAAPCRPVCRQQPAQAQPQQRIQAAHQGRRQLLAGLGGAAAALAAAGPAAAMGLESIDLPAIDAPEIVAQMKARNQQVLDDAEATFQNSGKQEMEDLLRQLKERSDANRAQRKRDLEDRYCMRQAELGVGDCGGLRLIPGMTKSGVQKRPEWLDSLLGLDKSE